MTDMDAINELIKEEESLVLSEQLKLYAQMSFVREVEELIAEKYSDQIFRCPVHLSVGQEAIAIGVCSELTVADKIMSTHRSHAHYLAKGGDLYAMFCELMGKEAGCCLGRGGSMHLIDKAQGFYGSIPIVGSSLPIAMGIALAEKQSKSSNVVVAFVGDAAVETGQFHESLNFISLMKLPILIVLENNGYSTYAPINDRQPKDRDLSATAKGFGIPFFSANGDEIESVVKLTKESLVLVRSSHPVLIEFSTFRRYEHCGPSFDDELGYRSESEIKTYSQRDPLEKFTEAFISEPNFVKISESIQRIANKYVVQVFERALNAPQGNVKLNELDAISL
jgi:TPP-dependent pyruvate/acetoin dehydrogenase alpha subunit